MASAVLAASRRKNSERQKVKPTKRAFRNVFAPSTRRGKIYKRRSNQPPRPAGPLTRRERLEAEREGKARRIRPGSNSPHSQYR